MQQQNSFFMGRNYSNRDFITDARTGWSLCPVQDIDTVLTNKYGMNVNVDVDVDDTFSALYCDLYRRQMKEALKNTMLIQESVFESQIHELHRLYWRQKELMMEMDKTRGNEALYLNSGFSTPRSHWMCSSISRNLRHEEDIEAGLLVDNKNDNKSEKTVLDLELPVFEFNDVNGEVFHEAPNFVKEQSVRRMSLESGKQPNKVQLDLNEPAKNEEHSDYVLNQFMSSVTSNEIGGESDTKIEGEGSVECRGEYGIDLNMSPTSSEEEVTIFNKFDTEKPQESLSVSFHGSEQLRMIVQALPCSKSVLLSRKSYKPRKKVKLGPSKGSESHSNHASTKKGSSSSFSKVKSGRNLTKQGKKRRCKPKMKSSNGDNVVSKKKRKKSRRICLVTEGNYQEISAAEAIVDMSRKSGSEASDCITSICRTLLWFAEISSSVVVGYEMDYSEAMTFQLTETKLEEHMNSADDKTTVSSTVRGKQRRSRAMQGKRKCKDDEHDDNPILGAFPECEANEDLQLIEAYESKWDLQANWGAIKKQRRGSRIPAADFQHMIIN